MENEITPPTRPPPPAPDRARARNIAREALEAANDVLDAALEARNAARDVVNAAREALDAARETLDAADALLAIDAHDIALAALEAAGKYDAATTP